MTRMATVPANTAQSYRTHPGILAYCLLLTLMQGCAGGLHLRAADDDDDIMESHCVPTTSPPTQVVTLPATGATYRIDGRTRSSFSESVSPSRFSPRAREMAAIIGVHDLLVEFQLLEDETAEGMDGALLHSLAVRQELSDRLLLALFEANSIAAELECEKARTEDLASQLEEARNDIQQGRTIMAILADSISGVFAGTFLLLGSEILSGLIDLSGSVAALGFGVAALGGDQAYEFKHGRNLMADVWQGEPTSRQFPQPVWEYLNGPVRPNGKRSRRDNIIGTWRTRLGKPGSKEVQRLTGLYFGRGGIYRINELRHRGDDVGTAQDPRQPDDPGSEPAVSRNASTPCFPSRTADLTGTAPTLPDGTPFPQPPPRSIHSFVPRRLSTGFHCADSPGTVDFLDTYRMLHSLA